MIGVTIGVGEYLPLAKQAADSMSRHTGLPCMVLTDEHRVAAGLSDQPAHLMKLHVWDFVDDDRVLFFDADTVCLRPWNPAAVAAGTELAAVRDWSWREGVKQEAEAAGVPADEYFLSSFMLLHRSTHQPMLNLARELYPQLSQRLFEQNALNAARHRLELPIRFLDRRFCWSRFGAGNLHQSGAAIIAHYNDGDLRSRWQTVANGGSNGSVDEGAFERLGNTYFRYSRIGHDERPILLRSDGTIGHGGGDAERFWFVRNSGSTRTLVLGSEDRVTCELEAGPNDIWRGNWAEYERMPIECMRHRAQVIVDLLQDKTGEWAGAELGVFEGQTSALLLRELPNLRLWMVDPWVVPRPGDRYWDDPYIRLVSPQQMEEALRRTRQLTAFARDRRVILMTDQVTAATCIADASLDFVFVDSDHSREGTLEAIDTWWTKLRPGGFMVGHDLDYPGFPGVRQAVEAASARTGLPWQQASDYVWWIQLPQ